MQTQTALVRSNRVIKLYSVTSIYLYLSLIVYPRNAEFELSVRLCQSFQQSFSFIQLLVCFNDRS